MLRDLVFDACLIQLLVVFILRKLDQLVDVAPARNQVDGDLVAGPCHRDVLLYTFQCQADQ